MSVASFPQKARSWLGPLPQGWGTYPLKHVAAINRATLSDNTDPDYEIEYIDISTVALLEGIKETETLAFENAPSRARRIVCSGDVLISTVRTYLRAIARVDEALPNLIASTGFAVVTPGEMLESTYFGLFATSDPFVEAIVAQSVGASYPATNSADIARLHIPVPPLETQRRIATFAQQKIAQLDDLIAKKRDLLKLLAEKRAALITRAVTKGLNPNAPMKPSGIDWLGEIPAHWEVLPIRRLSHSVKTGATPPSNGPDYFTDGTVNWYAPGDFTSLTLGGSTKKLRPEAFTEDAAKQFPANCVLMVGIGATLGKVGHASQSCSGNQQVNAITTNQRILPFFLALFLNSHIEEVRMLANSSTIGILNQQKTKSLTVCVPPLGEQEKIIELALAEMTVEENARRVIEATVERLTEYRAAIVTKAVTGELEVT